METVVVALDTSSHSVQVREAAVTQARALKARLVLVRVVPQTSSLPMAFLRPPVSQLREALHEEAAAALQTHVAAVPAELQPLPRVVEGAAWRAIIEVARETSARVIVVGAFGEDVVEGLGSTSARVVNHAPCDVLVVRKGRA